MDGNVSYVDICIVTLPIADCDFEEDDVDVSEAMTGDDMLVLSGEEMTADSSGRAGATMATRTTMGGETGAASNIQEDSQSSNYFANNYR